MYFMTTDQKNKRIKADQDLLKMLKDRLKVTQIAIDIMEKEIEEAYNGTILEPLLVASGILQTRQNNSNKDNP